MKKYRPIIISGAIIIIGIVFYAALPSKRVSLECESRVPVTRVLDSIELKVYVENSGSMDGYMCSGSELKDAVFDYVSDLMDKAKSVELNYINSSVIPYHGTLEAYIKDLTPRTFAIAGGDKSKTDLRYIFQTILGRHEANTVSILVSDCILDIGQNATDYFGNCQVSLKAAFKDALKRMPLGVEIAKLESNFSGYWYCGNNVQKLSDVKRPYYIWIMGDANILSEINKTTPIAEVIHGIKEYCAFSPVGQFDYNIAKERYVVNRKDVINVSLLVDLDATLQTDAVLTKPSSYIVDNPNLVKVTSVEKISTSNSNRHYSHIVELEIHNPRGLNNVELRFSYPPVPEWVVQSNDDSGVNVAENLDKTTGLKYLVNGVAEAYNKYISCRNFTFNIKNK